MAVSGNNNALKTLTAVLTFLLLGLGIYTVKFYNQVKDNEIELMREKELVANELETILQKYNQELDDNNLLQDELEQARRRVIVLLDSLTTSETTWEVLQNYRKQIRILRNERDVFVKKADSLARLNQELVSQRADVEFAFGKSLQQQDSLIRANAVLEERLKEGAQLTVRDFTATGIIIRNSGSVLINDRASRIDKLQVCYTINENALAELGAHNIYLQIIDPSNHVLGDRVTIGFGDRTLTYSAYSKINYFLTDFRQCLVIEPYAQSFEKGLYSVNLFEDDRLLGSTRLQLR